MSENISSILKNWVPYKLYEEEENNYCRWLYLGDEKITEPFFNDTIASRRTSHNGGMQKCVSDLSILPEWSQQMESVSPTAFIFHISRCGSTLVSQLLGLSSSNIVLSEVPFFDELLRWGHKKKEMPAIAPLLKNAMEMYGARRNEAEKYLFIKTDSWHIHFYKQLRELYPQTPFILLYRRPDEVIRSQQKRRGMQSVQGVIEPDIFGFKEEEIAGLGFDEYMARVIEGYLQAFTEILKTDRLVLPVNYNEGGLSIVKKIAAFCDFLISDDEMKAMEQRSVFHGKYPGEVFSETQPVETVPAYLEKSFELYEEVERLKNVERRTRNYEC
jgi:hypothetical protein